VYQDSSFASAALRLLVFFVRFFTILCPTILRGADDLRVSPKTAVKPIGPDHIGIRVLRGGSNSWNGISSNAESNEVSL
jgi:hypothetical protein